MPDESSLTFHNQPCHEPPPDISVVVPFFNEEDSLRLLYDKLVSSLESLQRSFELIFVNDGSTDTSESIIADLQKNDSRINFISFPVNSGKAKALDSGFKASRGQLVFTLDADLQDDPTEFPRFIEKIEEGYDLVSGWKKERHDPLEKRLPSKLFNTVTSWVAGFRLHDFNCGFKLYRHEILDEIELYGELHRYVPVLAYWRGFRITEIPVRHHARPFGKSKYGWERYVRGFFDLFTVALLTRYIRTPMYLFGIPGLIILFMGIMILSFISFLQFRYGSILGHKLGRPNRRTPIDWFLTPGTGKQCSYHSKMAHVWAFCA
ncbi:glycosyltransferase family 2 protein [Desulforhabdus amnigena]|uniref:glycosyltransferase family 2 protein n=1 Tax=Desulforhabdus amnigena TaxID=40218 RepID=UPI002492357F|nr:glycosyltransferase family 2 protein [Desulforhabdus amnigena]